LCSLTGAKLTVVWEFGNYEALIAPDPAVVVLDRLPANMAAMRHIRMPLFAEGGRPKNRRVPVSEESTILVESWFWFGAAEEPVVYEKNGLSDWLPTPAEGILKTVRGFADTHFGRTVGMHIRSGDNDTAVVVTPLEAYLVEAERIIGEGFSIFLATDSAATEHVMLDHFGENIIVFPKTWDLPYRWPRLTQSDEALIPDWLEHQAGRDVDDLDHDLRTAGDELVPDFVDMQLLAACDHVIGSTRSSFGKMAALYNGSPKCLLLDAPPPHPIMGKALAPVQQSRKR
jgi:hypothetical protein